MHAYNRYLHTYVESLCNHPQSKIKTIAVMTKTEPSQEEVPETWEDM